MAYQQPYPVQYGQPAHEKVAMQTVVTNQPPTFTHTTTVVTQQPSFKDWNTGICACFEDMKSCCLAVCCGNFYYAFVATRMGESCCVGLCGDSAGYVPGGHMAMRTKLRAQHNIQGSICGDCFMTTCCGPCAMCQMSREMDHLGYPQGTC